MTKLETLPPKPEVSSLKEYLKQLKYTSMLKKRHLEKNLKGHLRISKKGRATQFYLVGEKPDKNGKYVPVKEKNLVSAVAQRDYEKKLNRLLEEMIISLEKFLKKWDKYNPDFIYDSLHWARKPLVEPDVLPDSQYAEKWLSKNYCGLDFYATDREYYTTEGLRVRSKSEIIIAETLYSQGIPFRYEYPVEIGGRTFHPDFYCLDLRTRNEFIWEHFGMLDDPSYAENAAGKLEAYIKSGWIPGKNLIITMETSGCPMNQQTAKKLAAAFF